jgi:hypothetical protein
MAMLFPVRGDKSFRSKCDYLGPLESRCLNRLLVLTDSYMQTDSEFRRVFKQPHEEEMARGSATNSTTRLTMLLGGISG